MQVSSYTNNLRYKLQSLHIEKPPMFPYPANAYPPNAANPPPYFCQQAVPQPQVAPLQQQPVQQVR